MVCRRNLAQGAGSAKTATVLAYNLNVAGNMECWQDCISEFMCKHKLNILPNIEIIIYIILLRHSLTL